MQLLPFSRLDGLFWWMGRFLPYPRPTAACSCDIPASRILRATGLPSPPPRLDRHALYLPLYSPCAHTDDLLHMGLCLLSYVLPQRTNSITTPLVHFLYYTTAYLPTLVCHPASCALLRHLRSMYALERATHTLLAGAASACALNCTVATSRVSLHTLRRGSLPTLPSYPFPSAPSMPHPSPHLYLILPCPPCPATFCAFWHGWWWARWRDQVWLLLSGVPLALPFHCPHPHLAFPWFEWVVGGRRRDRGVWFPMPIIVLCCSWVLYLPALCPVPGVAMPCPLLAACIPPPSQVVRSHLTPTHPSQVFPWEEEEIHSPNSL